MGTNVAPVVLPCMILAHFLDYILRHHAVPTTAVICSTRESFLEQLYASVSDIDSDEGGDYRPAQSLLVPTIYQLATSRTVNLAFAPTLAHLRAYLATFEPNADSHSQTGTQNPNQSVPMLLIFGVLELHRSTSEYSAQGLSRTLAIAVEGATAACMKLIIAEPLKIEVSEDPMHATGVDGGLPIDPWKDQIPLLNGSVRFGREDRIWAGRTVEAARVLSRWCRFIRLHTEMEE